MSFTILKWHIEETLTPFTKRNPSQSAVSSSHSEAFSSFTSSRSRFVGRLTLSASQLSSQSHLRPPFTTSQSRPRPSPPLQACSRDLATLSLSTILNLLVMVFFWVILSFLSPNIFVWFCGGPIYSEETVDEQQLSRYNYNFWMDFGFLSRKIQPGCWVFIFVSEETMIEVFLLFKWVS